MTPLEAVSEALFGAGNGDDVKSLVVLWGEVSRGVLDISGSAMCVEWSSLRKPYPNEDLGNDLG